MSDEAPESSRHVRLSLFRLSEIDPAVIDRLEISTGVTIGNRARTAVQRPSTPNQFAAALADRSFGEVLRKLPGAGHVVLHGVGQVYEIEWDGICRPI